jgi:catechol 2,3-dioxygenase-like lactoylglutathione lyase family enzyme
MKIDHITLLVSSLEQSMPYYEHLLPLVGFSKKNDHAWTDGDGFYFQFLQAKPGTSPYERYGAGMNHLGFGAPSPRLYEVTRGPTSGGRSRQALPNNSFKPTPLRRVGKAS